MPSTYHSSVGVSCCVGGALSSGDCIGVSCIVDAASVITCGMDDWSSGGKVSPGGRMGCRGGKTGCESLTSE